MTVTHVFLCLGLLWVASEFGIFVLRRPRTGRSSGASVSNIVIWGLAGLGVSAASFAQRLRFASVGSFSLLLLWVALAVFVAGLALRWWAIVVLGRLFVSDLAILPGHRIIDTGPYRLVRHPSYSGLLVCCTGIGMAMHNWLSLVCLLLPITGAVIHRIGVEERMLETKFGAEYREYRDRTSRLVPGVF